MPERRSVKSGPKAARSGPVVAVGDTAADGHERARDFFGQAEIERLLKAARTGRHGARDHLLVLMLYRHGLRVSEAIALRRDDVDLAQSRLWVRRLRPEAWRRAAARSRHGAAPDPQASVTLCVHRDEGILA